MVKNEKQEEIEEYTPHVSYIEVFENINGDITIQDTWLDNLVSFDECMAEKLCSLIMKTANQIRENSN